MWFAAPRVPAFGISDPRQKALRTTICLNSSVHRPPQILMMMHRHLVNKLASTMHRHLANKLAATMCPPTPAPMHARWHYSALPCLPVQFMLDVIKDIKSLWPESIVVHGRARHSESQGSVERLNRDVNKMLGLWCEQNNTTSWSVGRLFVQWQYNTKYHSAIKQTPYRLVFGQVRSCSLPPYSGDWSRPVT